MNFTGEIRSTSTKKAWLRMPVFICLLALFFAKGANADWPYLVEEASNLTAGQSSLSIGVSRTRQRSSYRQFGVLLTPDKGTVWTMPEIQASLGLGDNAEVSVEYAYLRFEPESGGKTVHQAGDLKLWTKLGALSGKSTNIACRFGMKIPSSSNEYGLGTDEADVFLEALFGSDLGPVRLDLNAGLEIMGDPTKEQAQDDLYLYGASIKVPLGARFIVGLDAVAVSGPFHVLKERNFASLAAIAEWRGQDWGFNLAVRETRWDAESLGWIFGVTRLWN